MIIIATMSLSGGQGKTTVSLLLSRYLAQAGLTVIAIDADPQANLSAFLSGGVAEDEPTLLEVLMGDVAISSAIYPTEEARLGIIPADDGLDSVQTWLANSGMAVMIFRSRLEELKGVDVCIIDSPPQRSQICKSIIGAADYVVIPCEASVKGYGSLMRTLDAINELKSAKASQSQLLAVLPFRDRWVGNNQTGQSKESIEAMIDDVGADVILPSILESEKYKRAVTEGTTPHSMGFPDLGYPFELLTEKIRGLVNV